MSPTGTKAKFWPGRGIKSYESRALIDARKSTVWDVITDGGNFTVWNSGITHIDGELRHGSTIRVRTRTGGKRTFRLRVRQVPGEVMTWTGGVPLALARSVRTFTLTPHGGQTLLRVRQDFAGPLPVLLWNAVPDVEAVFAEYLSAVKKRAELLSRHEARIHASPRLPWGPGERAA
ncbi:SRPBCC family protein [Pseudarthrobacter sp. 1C304]|uniref:SRPBCC family protein n=1 Tax=Pseudarthrobacter sp. 1C304 TaxID=3457438 RepID=UPI003FD5FF3F